VPTYRLDLAYDGSGFHGYAKQPGVRTIQGDLEQALLHHTGPIETFVAGRTDKGVHATGQVVSFSTAADLDTVSVTRSLNRQLAPEVAVSRLGLVADDFHARFSAVGRRYRYSILTTEAPDPFRAATSWHYPQRLDLPAMNEAAICFVGEQDFASLCRRSGDASTIRDVREAHWTEPEPDLLAYSVSASSFCHQMVRSMVAICVDVGRGKIPPRAVPQILAAHDRNASRGAAPPHGLTLVAVDYPSAV
jgi:tRNA pseudouridine38-40 synthase